MRKFILRSVAIVLTFTLGLAGNSLFNGLGSLVERWIETPEPVLEEPCATVPVAQPPAIPLVRNCGLLVVKIGDDRSITLNGEEMGSLDNPRKLFATLNEGFTRRTEALAYRPGIDLNSQVPAEASIEQLVFIKAPRWISYGDVSDLIDVVRATGGKPIGLVTTALAIHYSLSDNNVLWAQKQQPCIDGD